MTELEQNRSKLGNRCGIEFEVTIDTGSPFSIIPIGELKRMVGKDRVTVREIIDEEQYVNFNPKPLALLGLQFARLLVRGVEISKTRVLVAKNGRKVIDRRYL